MLANTTIIYIAITNLKLSLMGGGQGRRRGGEEGRGRGGEREGGRGGGEEGTVTRD